LFSNIIHAYDRSSPIVSARQELMRHSTWPLKLRLKLAQDFIPNLVRSFYVSLKSFMTCSSQHQTLTSFERICLYERNIHTTSSLTGQLILRESKLVNDSTCMFAFTSFYNTNMLRQGEKIMKRLDCDSTLVKIFLLVISFSSNCFLINNDNIHFDDHLLTRTTSLTYYQHVYAELLWKYMIFRYDYWQAVNRFVCLIKQILDLIPLTIDAYNESTMHQDTVKQLIHRWHVNDD
jgi:hypothetical protein